MHSLTKPKYTEDLWACIVPRLLVFALIVLWEFVSMTGKHCLDRGNRGGVPDAFTFFEDLYTTHCVPLLFQIKRSKIRKRWT